MQNIALYSKRFAQIFPIPISGGKALNTSRICHNSLSLNTILFYTQSDVTVTESDKNQFDFLSVGSS